MTRFGYARVSTVGQDPSIQIEALKEYGCEVIRQERVSESSMNGRPELKTLLDFIQPGDELVVTRIDRLGRSFRDFQDIVHLLKDRGADLKATEQPVNTSSSEGKVFLNMLGVFAEFETNLRRERQAAGIAKAKERGVYIGRPRQIDGDKINQLHSDGLGAAAIAKELGISRTSVYRYLKRL